MFIQSQLSDIDSLLIYMHRGHKYQVKMQKQTIAGHPVGMSFRDVLRVSVTESLDFPPPHS